ncbi:hypothetical protein THO17_35210 [Marinomonas sp. THO17]
MENVTVSTLKTYNSMAKEAPIISIEINKIQLYASNIDMASPPIIDIPQIRLPLFINSI